MARSSQNAHEGAPVDLGRPAHHRPPPRTVALIASKASSVIDIVTMRRPVERPGSAAVGNARRKLAKKREAIGFVGRVGMIGEEGLEDAFGDFREFYITFAKIFSTVPAQVRPSRRMSGSRHQRLQRRRRQSRRDSRCGDRQTVRKSRLCNHVLRLPRHGKPISFPGRS